MENRETGLTKLTESIESVLTGVPAPVRKNFLKAVGQLCTAAVDIPIAWLEGKSAEIREATEARLKIIRKEGESISEQIDVPKEYIVKASSKYASKVIKEQLNLDQITFNAANELANKFETNEDKKEAEDISEDWLNEFENLARLKSSEDMRLIFGKILSGEIVKPGSFSIRTIKIISQLDNQAAKLFQTFCSLTVSVYAGKNILDARVLTFNGKAGSNSLEQYGLSFQKLNILHEFGLINPTYDSTANYSSCIVNEKLQLNLVLHFQEKKFGLVPLEIEKYDKDLWLNGVALTTAGKELLGIIPMTASENYFIELTEFFKSKQLELVEIK